MPFILQPQRKCVSHKAKRQQPMEARLPRCFGMDDDFEIIDDQNRCVSWNEIQIKSNTLSMHVYSIKQIYLNHAHEESNVDIVRFGLGVWKQVMPIYTRHLRHIRRTFFFLFFFYSCQVLYIFFVSISQKITSGLSRSQFKRNQVHKWIEYDLVRKNQYMKFKINFFFVFPASDRIEQYWMTDLKCLLKVKNKEEKKKTKKENGKGRLSKIWKTEGICAR